MSKPEQTKHSHTEEKIIQKQLAEKGEVKAGQIQILVPEKILHRLTGGLGFGLLLGIGFVIGLIITALVIAGILGYLLIRISP